MLDVEQVLEGLTEAQRTAVRHVDGPLLVLAGPGSGKTTVVTRRITHLVATGIPAWQILALTFTNKAAAEMRHRVVTRLPEDLPGKRGLTVTTFHAFCARILRRYAPEAGLTPRYAIYDATDQRDLIKRATTAVDLNTKNWPPASVAGAISAAKNRLMDEREFAKGADDFASRTIARIYAMYQRLLREADAVDFDDLLRLTAGLLRTHEGVRRELQDRYRYILVDEYQDTNSAQFVIAHGIASAHRNICVVGDPDQSIYGWRGADIRNILDFETHYPDATIVPLGQNFRSTGRIVALAASLIGNNALRRDKRLYTELEDGEQPRIIVARNERHEANLIADEFRRLHEEAGLPWREMAILYRVNALSRALEDAFRAGGIPHVIARGTAFYERREVKDAIAYLRLVANPRDEVSLRRIVNTPARGIGRATLQRIELFAIDRGLTLFDAMAEAASIADLSSRAAASVLRFVETARGWIGAAGPAAAPPVEELAGLVDRILRESGLEASLRASKVDEDQERVENLAELVSAAAELDAGDPVGAGGEPATLAERLVAFLESVSLVSDADAIDPAGGAVTLMTLHTAKGLEFDVVAIAGLEEGLLPHSRAAHDEAELEEERRLCFVGVTRARRHLLLTRTIVRTHRGMRERSVPSLFLRELGPDVVELDRSDEFDERPAGMADEPDDAFPPGCRVRHPSFGYGRVESVTRRPRGSAARVMFETVGAKTLILEYARLVRIE